MNRSAFAAATVTLTAVLVVTVSPLQVRPRLAPPQLERSAAWALVGALGALAFPRRAGVVALAVAAMALGSETLQMVAPGRHPRVADAAAKGLGAIAGVLVATLLDIGRRVLRDRGSALRP